MTTRRDVDVFEEAEVVRQAKDPFRRAMLERHPRLYRHLADEPTRQGEPIAREGFAVGPGWWPLIERLSDRLDELAAGMTEGPRVVQVKQKFGILRFYVEGELTEEMSCEIDKAEELSEATCETCGQPGRLRTRGGAITACDEHADVDYRVRVLEEKLRETLWIAKQREQGVASREAFREAFAEVLEDDNDRKGQP